MFYRAKHALLQTKRRCFTMRKMPFHFTQYKILTIKDLTAAQQYSD